MSAQLKNTLNIFLNKTLTFFPNHFLPHVALAGTTTAAPRRSSRRRPRSWPEVMVGWVGKPVPAPAATIHRQPPRRLSGGGDGGPGRVSGGRRTNFLFFIFFNFF
jgi:hypothetical protein